MVVALEKVKTDLEQLQQEVELRSEELIELLEARLKAKRAELEQLKEEQRAQLTDEIVQLRRAIEKEKQEREVARAQFSARIERNVAALQAKLEQEQTEVYEKLRLIIAENGESKLRQVIKGNLLLKSLQANEEKLYGVLQKRGNILHRNPNAKSKQLGNLQKHLERQLQRKKAQLKESQRTKQKKEA
jgi:hypothetical protein